MNQFKTTLRLIVFVLSTAGTSLTAAPSNLYHVQLFACAAPAGQRLAQGVPAKIDIFIDTKGLESPAPAQGPRTLEGSVVYHYASGQQLFGAEVVLSDPPPGKRRATVLTTHMEKRTFTLDREPLAAGEHVVASEGKLQYPIGEGKTDEQTYTCRNTEYFYY